MEKRWYVISTYTNREKSTADLIIRRCRNMDMAAFIFDAFAPTKKVEKVGTDGKIKSKEEILIPGYIFVKMIMTPQSWGIVRYTPGVHGYVPNNHEPIPIDELEVNKLLIISNRIELIENDVHVGDVVSVGDNLGMEGIINNVDINKNQAEILVNMFGRKIPVKVSLDTVRKIGNI